jgi:hypothetical protein
VPFERCRLATDIGLSWLLGYNDELPWNGHVDPRRGAPHVWQERWQRRGPAVGERDHAPRRPLG